MDETTRLDDPGCTREELLLVAAAALALLKPPFVRVPAYSRWNDEEDAAFDALGSALESAGFSWETLT